jgi:high-affinity nickel-transport protein
MTLVDSLDSVLMLYAYAGPTQDPSISKFALTFKDDKSVLPAEGSSNELVPTLSADPNVPLVAETGEPIEPSAETGPNPKTVSPQSDTVERGPPLQNTREQRLLASKANTISSLSITLTLLSILVALRWVPHAMIFA